MCTDGIDHQQDGGTDVEAQGCVRPLWQQPSIEGNTWETQMTALINQINLNSDEDCGGRFGGTAQGEIDPRDDISIRTPKSAAIQGNDNQNETFGAEITEKQTNDNGIITDTTKINLTHLDKERREGIRQYKNTDNPNNLEWGDQEGYATGIINETQIELRPGINIENGTHIETQDYNYQGETKPNIVLTEAPHNKGDIDEGHENFEDSREGNSRHDNPQINDWESSNELNYDTSETGDSDENWRKDYGEVVRVPETKTNDDVGSEPSSAECTGCRGSEGETPDSVYVEGDELVYHREVCCTSNCGKNNNYTSYSSGCNNTNTHDCNQHNGINVGERNEGVGNDPGGTYTDYTGHEYPAENTVSCGMDETLTVNADGPNGEGNGWIVIDETAGENEDRIVGREGLDGEENVGHVHHYRNSAGSLSDNWDTTDFLDDEFNELDSLENPECQGDRTKCIKYIDFWTDPTGSEWTEPADAVNSEIIYEVTADQGYSVCKNINRIYQEYNGVDEELVVCDYKENSFNDKDHEATNIAPLPEACGDEPNEHVYWMEGPEVHDGTLSNYHAHQQRCIRITDDDVETEMDGQSSTQEIENACLNKGDIYREGTVKPVRRHEEDHEEVTGSSPDYMDSNNGAPPIDSDNSPNDLDSQTGPPVYEAEGGIQRESPDWEVCLNIEEDQGSNEPGIGGQWYDLDDDIVGEYLRGEESGEGSGSLLLLTLDRFNRNHITYYWRQNQNPQHSIWNQMGLTEGTALEQNCGNNDHPQINNPNNRGLCGDADQSTRFYNFFRQAGGYTDFRQEVY